MEWMNASALKRHYYIRSFILLGFTFLLADLIATERLGQYLAPRLHILSYVTLFIFVLLTGASLRQAIVGPTPYECECADLHHVPGSRWKSMVIYGLFLLPLAMGFFMPEKILGSALAEKRGLNLLSGDTRKLTASSAAPTGELAPSPKQQSAGQTAAPRPEAKAKPKTDEDIRKLFAQNDFGDFYTDLAVSLYKQPVIQLNEKVFLDGLTIMDLYPKEFAGKELETIGFVYREPTFQPHQFVVARFSVTCCTADAAVYGVMVEDPSALQLKKDSWVKVRGKLELRTVDGYDMLVLKAASIKPVQAPKDPYVYYNYGNSQ
jgi:putative membrane protein